VIARVLLLERCDPHVDSVARLGHDASGTGRADYVSTCSWRDGLVDLTLSRIFSSTIRGEQGAVRTKKITSTCASVPEDHRSSSAASYRRNPARNLARSPRRSTADLARRGGARTRRRSHPPAPTDGLRRR
jgi:hypothetical protein